MLLWRQETTAQWCCHNMKQPRFQGSLSLIGAAFIDRSHEKCSCSSRRPICRKRKQVLESRLNIKEIFPEVNTFKHISCCCWGWILRGKTYFLKWFCCTMGTNSPSVYSFNIIISFLVWRQNLHGNTASTNFLLL